MRPQPLLIAILVAMVMAPHAAAQPADWTRITPQVTTQAELTTAFGPPEEVIAKFPWSEWSATWKKRPLSSSYTLRYRRGVSRPGILEGPAGTANSVEVTIAAKKVLAVEWIYEGPVPARAAAAIIRSDPQMMVSPDTASQLYKDVPGGWLAVTLGPDDSTVRILFQMK